MSVGSVLIYIQQETALRRGYARKSSDDETHLQIFYRLLAGREKDISKLPKILERGIQLPWEDVYDYVNPFGDRRGDAFYSVWTFDFRKDILFLTKKDTLLSAPLNLAYTRLLTTSDFEPLEHPPTSPSAFSAQPLIESFWEPKLHVCPRKRAFLGRILSDFSYTLRHVLRRPMNATTFKKLAYATIWISKMEFSIHERIGFDYISTGGPYVKLADLPQWETPSTTGFQVGDCWVVLAQDISDGIVEAQRHSYIYMKPPVFYIVLTLRSTMLGNFKDGKIQWTRAERLFDGTDSVSDTAIDMLIWASNIVDAETQPTTLSMLPLEILDRILNFTTASSVASAKLGCELGLGSPFPWIEEGVKLQVEVTKKHRFESSAVESQIVLNGVMSGLSYKREHGYTAIPWTTL